jgi:anion-transporting  ArsA/GET3 family ATPase
LPGLLDKDLVVVTGKGGVGKSTISAALGILAARRGRRVVVAEVGGRADTVRMLAGTGVTQLTITPGEAKDEYLHDQLPGPLAELLSRSGTFAAFVEATPGMAEMLTIGKVWELIRGHRRDRHAEEYDLVVLDAPASGHGLALLGAPRTFADAARMGPIHHQASMIGAVIGDPARTAAVAVTLAEEMPVNETIELRRALHERIGLDLSLVVANAIWPDRISAADAEALEALGEPEDSPVGAALWSHRRAHAQHNQLRRLRARLDAPPVRVPFAAEPDLEAIADCLEAVL